jgi:hypothetical protein
MRHTIYDRIVRLLSDRSWHDVRVLEQATTYPQYWLATLRRDPKFEVDESKGRPRLRPYT